MRPLLSPDLGPATTATLGGIYIEEHYLFGKTDKLVVFSKTTAINPCNDFGRQLRVRVSQQCGHYFRCCNCG